MTRPFTSRDLIPGGDRENTSWREADWEKEPEQLEPDRPVALKLARSSRRGFWLATGLILLLAVAAGATGLWLLTRDDEPAPTTNAPQPLPVEQKEFGPNVILETQGARRRVILRTKVCLREGVLEGLLTIEAKKEHEYIVAIDADALLIHTALLAAGARQGQPVQFDPVYKPATGTRIRVLVRYEVGGVQIERPAQEWIRYVDTTKSLKHDWVFAGSKLFSDVDDPQKKYYLANQGDVICVSNRDIAMLDLPIESPDADPRAGGLFFEAFSERIPPVGTPVEVILEPVF